ncbi:MAG: TlpA family protein disulfide reductase [Alkalispirochaeta sp.]
MRITATVFLILSLIPAVSVSAGGSSEDPQRTPPSTETTDATTAGFDDEARAEIQEILSGFGIQTFRGKIDAVDFGLPRLSGGETTLSDLQGQFVFLNFWATWCPPCREEMPSMETLYTALDDAPFEMIAVNVREDRDTVQGFIDEFGYSYPVLLDGDGSVSTNYGVRGIPTTFFIGPDGTVLGMLVGTRYWDEDDVMDGMRRIVEIVAER